MSQPNLPHAPITELQANYQKFVEIFRDNPREVAKEKFKEFLLQIEEKAKSKSGH